LRGGCEGDTYFPRRRDLAKAEFSTLRLRLIKIATRVIETTSRVRFAFAAACPKADLFHRGLTRWRHLARDRRGRMNKGG
jgi:hypothetical protein